MVPNLYGLILALAILVAWVLAHRLAGRFGIERSHIDGALLWVVIFGFLGARFYLVGFFWQYFREHPQEILAIWKGGLSIYGAILGGMLGALIYAWRAKISGLKFLDLLAVVLPLSQSIGRWGNYFNQEAFGYPTDLPWKMYVEPAFRPPEYLTYQFFHPAFLYESLWNLAVFLILLMSLRVPRSGTKQSQDHNGIATSASPPRNDGMLIAFYLILYPLGRFFIEPLRLDSVIINSFRVDQITSLVMMLVGLTLLIVNPPQADK